MQKKNSSNSDSLDQQSTSQTLSGVLLMFQLVGGFTQGARSVFTPKFWSNLISRKIISHHSIVLSSGFNTPPNFDELHLEDNLILSYQSSGRSCAI